MDTKAILTELASSSQATARHLQNVLESCVRGDVTPDDAAKIGVLGSGIARNNRNTLDAVRTMAGGDLLPSAKAWTGIGRPQGVLAVAAE